MSVISKTNYKITFLGDTSPDEIVKLIDTANKMIENYFGIRSAFDIIICKRGWKMEVQVLSWQRCGASDRFGDGEMLIAITDYGLNEIVTRSDKARFVHYLHELINGIVSPSHTRLLEEALAWYFTLKLLKPYENLKASYPPWIDSMYLSPMKQLAAIVGDDILSDFSVGKCCLANFDNFPREVKQLFMPMELFYASGSPNR